MDLFLYRPIVSLLAFRSQANVGFIDAGLARKLESLPEHTSVRFTCSCTNVVPLVQTSPLGFYETRLV